MNDDIKHLRDIHRQLWKKSAPDRFGFTSWWPIRRILNSRERKFLYRCIINHNLICKLETRMNQGITMLVYEPCEAAGIAPYPGVTFSIKDLKHIINIDELHIFDNSPTKYKYSNWCKNKGKTFLDLSYKFFTSIVSRKENLKLLRRYNMPEPLIQPISYFEY